jgi:L-alanine-DL-glutamate epimerase-like enolase superfamily enzyme
VKVQRLRVRRLTGTMTTDGPFWEERLVRPIDVYPEYRHAPWAGGGEQVDDRHFRLTQDFLEVVTDDGITGVAGPLWPDPARLVLTQLSHLLVGQDPLATERLWDQVHRFQVHGRQGDAMIALSAVDCALWDIKGQAFGQPLWRLLGGPTRTEVPAYASMLGHAVEDLGKVRDRALRYKRLGYPAQKWFFRHGPMSGHDGLRKNVGLVRTLRETLGDDYDIMLDCWQSMSFDYAVDLCQRIEEYRPRWIEEVFMPDRIDSHVKLKAKTRIPLAGAEHEYTRWGFKRFVEKDALDVLQPDIYWCGGLSETLKIAAYATVHDLITIPHGHSTPMGIHFSATQSPIHTPYQEYLVKWNDINMHFLKHPVRPVNGVIRLPEAPGAQMALDPDKIEQAEEVRV